MNWDATKANAKFEFLNLQQKDEFISFKCIESSPEHKWQHDWKLIPMPADGKFVKMTLKSHPGKALIRQKKEKVMHQNKEVRWYRIGEEEDACTFLFQS